MQIRCQFLFFFYSGGNFRQLILPEVLLVTKEAITSYVLIFILGNIVFLFFEQPISNLFQYYLGIRKRSEVVATKNSNVKKDL